MADTNGQVNGEGRAKNGCFAKGHPFIGNKNGLKNGRKKAPKTVVTEAIDAIDSVRILKKLEELCLKGDAKSCMYLLDRKHGKPRQLVGLEGSKLGESIQTFIFLMPDGTKVVPKELMNGAKGTG